MNNIDCLRCGHSWIPRCDNKILVKVCPKCHSPYWDRKKVNGKTNGAINGGKLVRPQNCSKCGKEKGSYSDKWNDFIFAHHEDYSKPLEITWLCGDCHVARHVEIGSYVNNGKKEKDKILPI